MRVTTDVLAARDVLVADGIVAVPTETVYGLAALVHSRVAVERVFDVKGRPRTHPLIVHLSSRDDPMRWGVLPAPALELARAFWPGPLTLLVTRTDLVPDLVTGGRDTVALRVPDHPLALALLDVLDDALVAPSANRFGRVSPTTPAHVVADLGDDVDLVLDGGPCRVGVESTIVDCTGDELQLLRPGWIGSDDIAAVCGVRPVHPRGESRAPGMLASHYAPESPVVLCESPDEARRIAGERERLGERAIVVWHSDVREYATRLYDDLRRADEYADVIVAVLPVASGLGLAVRDRLAKAAHPR